MQDLLQWELIKTAHAARHGAFRNRQLFLLAIIGGSIGSIAGMYTFHHKTLHPQFVWGMPAILILQIAAVLYILFGPVSISLL
ncbi:MAG: DUF1294 domain-containing protein [Gallintestinimicrobium sp.]